MKKFIFGIFLALSLAGCAGKMPSLNLSNSVSLNTTFGLTNAYAIAQQQALAYRSLPLCKTGTAPSPTNICAKRSIIVRLQAADFRATAALVAVDRFLKTYPTLDASNVIATAQTAVASYQSITAALGSP